MWQLLEMNFSWEFNNQEVAKNIKVIPDVPDMKDVPITIEDALKLNWEPLQTIDQRHGWTTWYFKKWNPDYQLSDNDFLPGGKYGWTTWHSEKQE